MGFHKSVNGIPLYMEVWPREIVYKDLGENIECFFRGTSYGVEYIFKAAWPKNEPADVIEGVKSLISCRLIQEKTCGLILFVNEIGIVDHDLRQTIVSPDQNEIEDYYPKGDEKIGDAEEIASVTPVIEDILPQESSTSAATTVESKPNCETKVNEVQYKEPQQCDADELTY